MTIRTPDQRLRIFVSSTLQELADERRVVRQAIEALRLTPVMFELGARPHPPRALYRAYLEQSDVFVGLYWQRYGWLAPGEEVSGLEDEYRLAGDRPKLIYLKEPAPDREPRLARLLNQVQADDRATYHRFSDADELRMLVVDDLAILLSERFDSTGTERLSRSLLPPDERPLPRPMTRLIGREAEVGRVAAILADPSRRLVTIVGPGGVGKTRLALEVAERLRGKYAAGIFFVPLAALAEPRLVIPTMGVALGIAEEGGLQIGLTLHRALSSAHCLIVLDNLEHLKEAASELVELIAATSDVQILATSRSVLDVSGEYVFELGPLALPTRDDEQTSAVELFLERSASISPGFAPSAEDRAAIEELTRRLDGLPLAIELAAARMRVLSPRGLLQRMGHRRLQMLNSGRRDLPARQHTLRETIAWSYTLLDPAERTLFERLAVVVGSADLASIEAITDFAREFNTVDVLGSLIDASLVRTIGEAGEVRFGMLETTREFANERLEAGGGSEHYRSRHAEHYLALAAEGSVGLRGSAQLDWLSRFDRENDNFRAVMRRAIRQGDAATGVRLGFLCCWFWLMRSLYTEGRSWMEALRDMPGATPRDRSAAWTVEALLAIWQGDFDFVETGVDEAVKSLRAEDDASTLGLALLLKAAVGGVEAGQPEAQKAAAEASTLLYTQGDAFLQGITLLGRSFVARRVGRFEEAADLAKQALDLSTSVGESYIRSAASTALATIALQRSDLAEVRVRVREALNAAMDLRNLSSVAYALELWSAAEMQDHRIDRAGRLYALAERAYGLARSQPWRPDALRDSIAAVEAALGSRVEQMSVEARELDLDAAIAELADSQPASGSPPR